VKGLALGDVDSTLDFCRTRMPAGCAQHNPTNSVYGCRATLAQAWSSGPLRGARPLTCTSCSSNAHLYASTCSTACPSTMPPHTPYRFARARLCAPKPVQRYRVKLRACAVYVLAHDSVICNAVGSSLWFGRFAYCHDVAARRWLYRGQI